MKQRILTALLAAPLAIAAILWLPTTAVTVILVILLGAGLWEWSRLAGLASRPIRLAYVLAVIATFVALAWLSPELPSIGPWLLAIAAVGWLAAFGWLAVPGALAADSTLHRAVKLAGGALATIAALYALWMIHGGGPFGHRWMLYAVVLIWAADSFAYFVGRAIGGAKLAPSISPGKTWAGFFGGLGGATLLAIVVGMAGSFSFQQTAWLAGLSIVVAAVSVGGDLVESLLKRQAGVKDSGALFPGHGGVLDRIDSLLAAAPFFAFGMLATNL